MHNMEDKRLIHVQESLIFSFIKDIKLVNASHMAIYY